MSKSFRKLILYIRGDKKIRGLDFSGWNYSGAIRSLEITFNKKTYHPHYHVGLVLDLPALDKKYINTYSYNNKAGIKELKRLFSFQEILIQKIWYLLINKETVTKKNIESLELGYSCSMDKFRESDFAELFKYITKEKNEDGLILSYDNFKTLYNSLYRVKQIQGYGVLYRITDDIDLEEYENIYNNYIESLQEKESPLMVLEAPEDLLSDNKYKLISRKSYYKYLRTLYQE
jgi:hypothetical protein